MANEITPDAANPGFNYYGRWQRGATAVTINSGAFVEFAYTGGACTLIFDVRGFSRFPAIFVQADSAPIRAIRLSANMSRVIITPEYALPSGTRDTDGCRKDGRHHYLLSGLFFRCDLAQRDLRRLPSQPGRIHPTCHAISLRPARPLGAIDMQTTTYIRTTDHTACLPRTLEIVSPLLSVTVVEASPRAALD